MFSKLKNRTVVAAFKRIFFTVVILAGLLFTSTLIAATKYDLSSYQSGLIINEHNACRVVSSSDSRGIFIPTKTSDEWSSFRSYKPSNVYLENCYYGCTDGSADNYDSGANIDDDSCEYGYGGCTDPDGNNYDSGAAWDDGSCSYPPPPPPPPSCSSNAGNRCDSYNACRQPGYYDCSGACIPTPESSCPGPGPYCNTYTACIDYRYTCANGTEAPTCGQCYATAPVTYCTCYDSNYNQYPC